MDPQLRVFENFMKHIVEDKYLFVSFKYSIAEDGFDSGTTIFVESNKCNAMLIGILSSAYGIVTKLSFNSSTKSAGTKYGQQTLTQYRTRTPMFGVETAKQMKPPPTIDLSTADAPYKLSALEDAANKNFPTVEGMLFAYTVNLNS